MKSLIAQQRAIRGPWGQPMRALELSDVRALFALREGKTGADLADEDHPEEAITRVVARGWADMAGAEERPDLVVSWARPGWLRPRLFLERVYLEKAKRGAQKPPPLNLAREPILRGYRAVNRALARASSYSFKPEEVSAETLARLAHMWAGELAQDSMLRMYVVTWSADQEPRLHQVSDAPGNLIDVERTVALADLGELAQGQRWMTSGAGGVLFIAADRARLNDAGEHAASDYFECLLHTGRIGQRSVLLMEQLGLRARMTPALDEAKTCKALGVDDVEPLYLLRFGYPTSRDR